MKEYKRLDPERPYTFAELLQKTKFFKKSELIKLLEKIVAAQPSLKERAMYMNKEMDFYSRSIISVMSGISLDFKKAKEDYEIVQKQHSPAAKLNRLLS